MKRALLFPVVLLLVAAALLAHDTWLVPAEFRVVPGKPVQVALNTSEDFPTSEAAPTPDRIARFEAVNQRLKAAKPWYSFYGVESAAALR